MGHVAGSIVGLRLSTLRRWKTVPLAFTAGLWSVLACYHRLCLTASSRTPRFKSVKDDLLRTVPGVGRSYR